MEDEGYEIALIHFDREGKEPFSVIMDSLQDYGRAYHEYDVDHSKRDGYAYHLSGGGGMRSGESFTVNGPYWVRDASVPVRHAVSPQDGCWIIDGKEVPFSPVRLLELPDPWKTGRDQWGAWYIFEGMVEASVEYCQGCEDYLHANWDQICPHIRYCNECGQFSNPAELNGPSKARDEHHCCFCGEPFEE